MYGFHKHVVQSMDNGRLYIDRERSIFKVPYVCAVGRFRLLTHSLQHPWFHREYPQNWSRIKRNKRGLAQSFRVGSVTASLPHPGLAFVMPGE